MRHLLFALILVALLLFEFISPFVLLAQAPQNVIWGEFTPQFPAAFDQVYWASKSPAVNALCSIADLPTRTTQATALAMAGTQIDVVLNVWCWDPFTIMSQRLAYGYTWVPALGQPPIQTAPGLFLPGLQPYDAQNPPGGSILVSIDPKDYPPFQ